MTWAFDAPAPFWAWNPNIPAKRVKYQTCWCLVFFRHDENNSHGISITGYTVKPVYNDHLYNKIYYLWFIP